MISLSPPRAGARPCRNARARGGPECHSLGVEDGGEATSTADARSTVPTRMRMRSARHRRGDDRQRLRTLGIKITRRVERGTG